MAGGFVHSLGVKNDGTAWAWGSSGYGQLGDGSTQDRNKAVQVAGLSGVTALAAGECHSLGLKTDATVWLWGSLFCNVAQSTPSQVSGDRGRRRRRSRGWTRQSGC